MISKELPNIMTCDPKCIKCFDNTGQCLECNDTYSLKENKCILICSDDKCLDCSLKEGKEICNKCEKDYKPNIEKCDLKCSDENCSKCSKINNIESCTQCKQDFIIKNGKCVQSCKDKYCETCSEDGKNCTECQLDKKLINGKCASQSRICSQFFQYCNYCFESDICAECQQGYELDSFGKNCKKNSNYISIIFTVLGISIILIGIISYCVYQKRKRDLRGEIRRMRIENQRNNNISIYRRDGNHDLNVSGSSRSVLSKEELIDEFENLKRKKEKGNQMCQFCKKKPAKFKCDCGCMVCKEHSSLKKQEGDGEIYKVCYVCDKIVKKVIPIKYPCHICFGKKINVCHFKCGCALEVCKDCYIKCKMQNNKCPGCRGNI